MYSNSDVYFLCVFVWLLLNGHKVLYEEEQNYYLSKAIAYVSTTGFRNLC